MSEYNKKFEESRLRFSFNEQYWNKVIQFDEHPDYKKIKNNLIGTKGVDFLGTLRKNTYFIEVKNFKDYRIKNKSRLQNIGEDLMIEVAQKVRDSIACILSGKLNSTNDKELWNEFLNFIIDENYGIKVILWLETDNISNQSSIRKKNRVNRNSVNIADYRRRLQSKLKWLIPTRANVTILNVNNYNRNLALSVISLPKENS